MYISTLLLAGGVSENMNLEKKFEQYKQMFVRDFSDPYGLQNLGKDWLTINKKTARSDD